MSFQIKKFNSIVTSMINWASGVTDRVTDYNVGSVIRTIFESVAMELEELYYQLLKAVEEAIEEAIYRTFNFSRNPAEKATGTVRFFRLTGTEGDISVPRGTLVSTDSVPPILFETMSEGTIRYYTGTATGGSTNRLIDTTKNFLTLGIQELSSGTAGAKVINITDNNATTDASGVTDVLTTTSSGDTLVFANLSGGATFADGGEYKIIQGYVDVTVRAISPGTGSNVIANSITIMKSSVPSVSSCTNPSAISDGREEETDSERKGRFALYIQSLARATKGALEYAARTVPEIISAKAIDDVRPNVYKYNSSLSSTSQDPYDDITAAIRNPGDRPVALFGANTIDTSQVVRPDDALYIGAKEVFEWVNMHLFSAGVMIKDPATNIVWEYSKGDGTWGTLTSYVVQDSTCIPSPGPGAYSGPLTQSGTLAFTPPSDWVSDTVHNLLRLWLRLRVLAGGTSLYSSIPTGDYFSLPPGLGYVHVYAHDGSGELNDTLKATVESAVEPYRGCGIIVEVKAPSVVTQTITIELLIAENYDTTLMATYVAQQLKDWVNSKALGDDLYIAEIYQFVMGVNDKAIVNSSLTAPISDVFLSSSQILRETGGSLTVTTTTEGVVVVTLGSITVSAVNVA